MPLLCNLEINGICFETQKMLFKLISIRVILVLDSFGFCFVQHCATTTTNVHAGLFRTCCGMRSVKSIFWPMGHKTHDSFIFIRIHSFIHSFSIRKEPCLSPRAQLTRIFLHVSSHLFGLGRLALNHIPCLVYQIRKKHSIE